MKTICFTLSLLCAVIWAYARALFTSPPRWTRRDPCAGDNSAPTHYANKYDDDVKLAMQQTQSRLESRVTVESGIIGASKSVDYYGATEVQQVTGRMQDVIYNETGRSRRWIDMADYDWADYVDSFDALRVLDSGTNKYVTLAVNAHNRNKDRVIIAALQGNARQTDESNTSSLVALPATQKVAVGGTGMTMAKIRTGLAVLGKAEVGRPEEGGELTFVYSMSQLTELMADSTLTSADYNTLNALQNFQVNQFMGMTWVRSELCPKVSTTRYCYIFAKEHVHLGTAADMKNDVSQVKTKRGLPWQIYSMMTMGAVRAQDTAVAEIACVEA